MFIIGNLIVGIVAVIDTLLFLCTLVIFISAIISLIRANPSNSFVKAIASITTPLYAKVKSKLPIKYWLVGHFDLVPLYILMVIILIDNGILPSLYHIGYSMQ